MSRKNRRNASFNNASEFINEQSAMYSRFTNNTKVDKYRIMEQSYLASLAEWSVTRFQWIGLPDTIDHRFLELELFYQGFVVFYYDGRFGRFLAVRATATGAPNVYGNPTGFTTVAMPGYSSVYLTPKECVPVWASYTRGTEQAKVFLYASRLAEIDVSLQTVQRSMRVNTVVAAKRSQQLTWQNVMRQVDEGIPVIYMDESFTGDELQQLNLGVEPRVLVALRDEKNQIWNEAMTMLGIDNANSDKKERLITDEVNANNGQVMVARNAAMKARREACEQINRMFKLSVSIEWDGDAPPNNENDKPESEDEEGSDNGDIHD